MSAIFYSQIYLGLYPFGWVSLIQNIRSSTVELVLGTLINFLNMKKINSRGMAQANKHTMMAALTYNLKKYMNFPTKLRKIGTNMLQKAVNQLQNGQNLGYRATEWLILGK